MILIIGFVVFVFAGVLLIWLALRSGQAAAERAVRNAVESGERVSRVKDHAHGRKPLPVRGGVMPISGKKEKS